MISLGNRWPLYDGVGVVTALILPAALRARQRDSAVLPHTRSGKIMRRLLKARELGLPEGDTSTLEIDDSRSTQTSEGE